MCTFPSVNLGRQKIQRFQLESRDKVRQGRVKRNFYHSARPLSQLHRGSHVYIDYAEQRGTVIRQRDENRLYNVKMCDGTVLRRH